MFTERAVTGRQGRKKPKLKTKLHIEQGGPFSSTGLSAGNLLLPPVFRDFINSALEGGKCTSQNDK